MNFTFSPRARTLSIALMLIGLLIAAIGWFTLKGDEHTAEHAGQNFWAALFINGFFFFGIARVRGSFAPVLSASCTFAQCAKRGRYAVRTGNLVLGRPFMCRDFCSAHP